MIISSHNQGNTFYEQSQFKQKNLPLILDKATPAEKLIIIIMIWKTLGLYENHFKNPLSINLE